MSIDLSGYTQMQKYTISKQLPEFAVEKKTPIQVKDNNYYNDQTWNNPSKASKKIFTQYHKQVEEGKDTISKQKIQELKDKISFENERKDFVNSKRVAELNRIKSRKQERLALQLGCMQDIVMARPEEVTEVVEMITERSTQDFQSQSKLINVKAQAHLTSVPQNGRVDNSWNKINQISKKYVDQAINQTTIKKDEEAVFLITQRIANDKEVENLKQQSYEKHHDETRNAFLKQHKRNFDFQTKCGLNPSEKPRIILQSKLNSAAYFKELKDKDQNKIALKDPIFLEELSKSQVISNESQQFSAKTPPFSSQSARSNQIVNLSNKSLQNLSALGATLNSSRHLDKKQQIQNPLIQYSQKPKEENIVIIHYNSINNKQTSQQLDQINIGDEQLTNSRLNVHASYPRKVEEQQRFLGQNQIQKRNNRLDERRNDREFLTSAQSHQKKTANLFYKAVHCSESVKNRSTSQQDNVFDSFNCFPLKNFEDFNKTQHPYEEQMKKPSRLDLLSIPKRKEFIPKDYLDRTEYKGLLASELTTLNLNGSTDFQKAMIIGSTIVNNKMNSINQARPSTQTSLLSRITQSNSNTLSFLRPSTTSSYDNRHTLFKNAQIPKNKNESCHSGNEIGGLGKQSIQNLSSQNTEEEEAIIQELDEFSKQRKLAKFKQVGFPKTALIKYQQNLIADNRKLSAENL